MSSHGIEHLKTYMIGSSVPIFENRKYMTSLFFPLKVTLDNQRIYRITP